MVNLQGILTDRHRQVISAVVEEITSLPIDASSLIFQLMPMTDVPAAVLEHEIISGAGGLTQERVLGSEGKSIAGHSSTSVLFKPGAYQEFIPFTEVDLLKLRKHGTIGERGATGLTGGELDFIQRAAMKLQMRLMSRAAQLSWDAIFDDVFIYQGVTKDFGRPAGNDFNSATDWSNPGVGTPFADLNTLIGNEAVIRKYRSFISSFIINPKTSSDIVNRALEDGIITNNNIRSADINEVRQFASPGLPPFEVVEDAVQTETVNADGSITLSDAEYLVPDDKVLIKLDFNKTGKLFPKYGELQITENQNNPSATLDRPAIGMYTFLDEEGLRKRKSPHVDVVAGFNGGPNLMRPDDVLIISV